MLWMAGCDLWSPSYAAREEVIRVIGWGGDRAPWPLCSTQPANINQHFYNFINNSIIAIFTGLKLWLATATHNFKPVKIMYNLQM